MSDKPSRTTDETEIAHRGNETETAGHGVETEAAGHRNETVRYETRVPSGESPAECPYCGRPLESEELLVLHGGIDHWERLGDDEREAFRETYREETEDLRTFRLKMLGLLVLVYFGFLFVYSYFSTDPFSAALFVVAGIPEFARGTDRSWE